MATVTPQMVKELREISGAGMTDCKKALDQAGGNIEDAMKILRERGLAAAAKKAGRAAAEGMVAAVVQPSGDRGYLFEVNCETDFVTRNESFQEFVVKVGEIILNKNPESVENLLALPYPDGGTVSESLTGLIAKIGENLVLRRYMALGSGSGFVNSYVHGNGRVGVLVELSGSDISQHKDNPVLAELAKDVALQVAAMKPSYLSRESIPADVMEREREVFSNQYRNQGKPEQILPKIVASRMETWYKESCLVEQAFVKEDSKSVGAYVTEIGRKLNVGNLGVRAFLRQDLGEGVDKKTVDFATEVAQQIAGK